MNNSTWFFLLILFVVKILAKDPLKTSDTIVIPQIHTFKIPNVNYRAQNLPEENQDLTHSNWSTLVEDLDFFNIKILAENWSEKKDQNVDVQCAKDITRFIEGLQKKETWALKESDNRELRVEDQTSLYFSDAFTDDSIVEQEVIGSYKMSSVFNPGF